MNNQPKFKLLKVITIAIGVLFTNITFAFDLYSEEVEDPIYNSKVSKEKHQREHKRSKHHRPANKHDKHSHKKKSKTNPKHNKATHEHRHHGKHKHKKT